MDLSKLTAEEIGSLPKELQAQVLQQLAGAGTAPANDNAKDAEEEDEFGIDSESARNQRTGGTVLYMPTQDSDSCVVRCKLIVASKREWNVDNSLKNTTSGIGVTVEVVSTESKCYVTGAQHHITLPMCAATQPFPRQQNARILAKICAASEGQTLDLRYQASPQLKKLKARDENSDEILIDIQITLKTMPATKKDGSVHPHAGKSFANITDVRPVTSE